MVDENGDIPQETDALLSALGEFITRHEQGVGVLSVSKMTQINFVYEAMKILTKGVDAKVTYEIHKPVTSMGSVTVEGKIIQFSDNKWFMKAAELASNIEVFPLLNGDVRMTFTFHGLVKFLED